MILALLFLPIALIVITIGLPVLLFFLTLAAMCIFAYQGLLFAYTDCKESWELLREEPLALRRMKAQCSRSVSPPPPALRSRSVSPLPALSTVPESSASSCSCSSLTNKQSPEYERPYVKVRHQDFDFTPRRRVRFA